jgi:DedD protein
MGLLSSIFKRPEAQSGASYRDGVSDELVEQTRTRARNRLIGALVLVIAGVVALPMLFDSEPRPLPGNTRIEVAKAGAAEPTAAPSKSSTPKVIDESLADAGAPVTRPAPAPAQPASTSASPTPAATATAGKEASHDTAAKPAAEAHAARESRSPAAVPAKPEPKSKPETAASRRETATRDKPTPAKTQDAVSSSDARARALLEGRDGAAAEAPAAAGGRFVVQVAAYADQESLNQARGRVQKLGLKTYTQQVKTGDGTRTRLRLGPFNDRAEADRVLERIKGAGLPGSVLTL